MVLFFSGWFKWLFCFCFCKQIKNGLKVSMNHRFNAFMNYNFEFYLTFFFFRVWMVYWDYTLILLNSSRKKTNSNDDRGHWNGSWNMARLAAKTTCKTQLRLFFIYFVGAVNGTVVAAMVLRQSNGSSCKASTTNYDSSDHDVQSMQTLLIRWI